MREVKVGPRYFCCCMNNYVKYINQESYWKKRKLYIDAHNGKEKEPSIFEMPKTGHFKMRFHLNSSLNLTT